MDNVQISLLSIKKKSTVFVNLYIAEIILLSLGAFVALSNYGVYLILYFSAIFCAYFYSYSVSAKTHYNRIYFIALVYAFFSLCLGLINLWDIKDIVGDSARFLAPFIAYGLGKKILEGIDITRIKWIFDRIIKSLLLLTSLNIIHKIYKLYVLDEPLISYPNGGVDVNILLFGYCLIVLGSVKKRIRYKTVCFVIVMLFLSDPILSMSKSGLLVSAAIIFVYLVLFASIKVRVISFFCFGYLAFYLTGISIESGILKRFINAIDVLKNLNGINPVVDYSTFTRLVEIRSGLHGLANSVYYPISYFLGLGSGSTWFAIDSVGTGLASENYRQSGGVHHIHIEIFSILFRHGIIGLLLYAYFFFTAFRRALYVAKKYRDTDSEIFSIAGAILLTFVGFATYTISDTSIYGKFSIGMLAAVVSVLLNLKTTRINA